MPFRRILVPVDLGEENARALEVAVELAGAGGANDAVVTLLHVIETIEDAPEDEVRDFYASLEERARRTMESLAATGRERGIRTECEIGYGRRARGILGAAVERRADLVVMRSHRVEPGRPGGGLGTLSHEVALLSETPVLLVK